MQDAKDTLSAGLILLGGISLVGWPLAVLVSFQPPPYSIGLIPGIVAIPIKASAGMSVVSVLICLLVALGFFGIRKVLGSEWLKFLYGKNTA